jgi:hypothetical protein
MQSSLSIRPSVRKFISYIAEHVSIDSVKFSWYSDGLDDRGYIPDSLERCKIWDFHGGDYEERCLLEWYAVWLL